MIWLAFALISPMLYGIANIIDEYFTNNLFKNLNNLVFYSSLTNIMFLPLIFLIALPQMITFSQLPYFIIIGVIGVSYLYPYYKALEIEDTSIVISLFSFGKIFVPLFAFLLVGEILSLYQYAGFFIIIFSGALLTLHNRTKKITFNKSLFYMAICSVMLALESVIYKHIFSEVSWSTGFTWGTIFSFLFVLPLIMFKKHRVNIKHQFRKFENNLKLFVTEEFLTFAGSAASTFAISLAAVSLVEAVDALQPIFVLFYAVYFRKKFPHVFKENTSKNNLHKKIILFILMGLGIALILI